MSYPGSCAIQKHLIHFKYTQMLYINFNEWKLIYTTRKIFPINTYGEFECCKIFSKRNILANISELITYTMLLSDFLPFLFAIKIQT